VIHEIAHIAVKPGLQAEFERGVEQAAQLLRRARGCRGLGLQRGIERPLHYGLVVAWDRVEDHTVHFRGSDGFQAWRGLVGHCFDALPVVEHVETALSPF
jgi:heme-degrading monooxygenase HmoA